jgi:hypothetical protein
MSCLGLPWCAEENASATNAPQRYYRCFGPTGIKCEFMGFQCQIPVVSATSGIS